MISKIIQFVKNHLPDIILLIGVILISLFSFLMGYIVAKTYEKPPIKFEQPKENSYYWRWDHRTLFGMENSKSRISRNGF